MSLEDVFKEFQEEKKEEIKKELKEKLVEQPVIEEAVETIPEIETKVEVEETKKDKLSEVFSEEEKEEPTFTFSEIKEDVESDKEIHLIYGDKGKGKTTLAFGYPGEIVCLSFDNKSAKIKATMYNNDKRIHIFNVTKYLDYDNDEKLLESSVKTYEYIKAVLEHSRKLKPDWIVFDGAEIFSQICEWRMRYKHNLGAFAGVTNLNLWKERRMNIRKIHNLALSIARKGIIYTTFTTKDTIVIAGEIITQKDVPKWIDVLMFETDYVIHVDTEPGTFRQLATVVTSKDKSFLKTGKVYDVTDKTLWEAIKS